MQSGFASREICCNFFQGSRGGSRSSHRLGWRNRPNPIRSDQPPQKTKRLSREGLEFLAYWRCCGFAHRVRRHRRTYSGLDIPSDTHEAVAGRHQRSLLELRCFKRPGGANISCWWLRVGSIGTKQEKWERGIVRPKDRAATKVDLKASVPRVKPDSHVAPFSTALGGYSCRPQSN